MPGSLQNKLQRLEISPPPGVWVKISSQLDAEFTASDAAVTVKLENATVAPPAEVWNKINASLHDQPLSVEEKEAPKTFPVIYRRLAAAAVIIGVLITTGLYLLRDKESLPENSVVQNVPKQVTPPATLEDRSVIRDSNDTRLTAQPHVRPFPAKKVAPTSAKNIAPVYDATQQPDESAKSPQEAPLYELHTVSALQPVSISAPPLRDKKGNIILDASLISNPDDEYIIVTGPNGKQTRISNKFLSCLGYINAGITTSDNDWRAIRCKTQFEEWRKRLLLQPAFIPTANNFFDIFELKDLLQEM